MVHCGEEGPTRAHKGMDMVIDSGGLGWYKVGSTKEWSDGSVWSITGTMAVGGKTLFVQKIEDVDGASRLAYRYIDATGLYDIDIDTGELRGPLVKLPLSVGIAWNSHEGSRYECTAQERVAVPAGVFYCLKVEIRGEVGEEGIRVCWIAKTVGYVKLRRDGATVSLSHYSISPAYRTRPSSWSGSLTSF